MTSLAEAIDMLELPSRSFLQMRVKLGLMTGPFSLRDVVDTAAATLTADTRSFSAQVLTPSGTALGGTVELTISGNGNYSFHVRLKDTGIDSYQFTVFGFLRSGSAVLTFMKSGRTGGWLSSDNSVFDDTESGNNPDIASMWSTLKDGAFSVQKEYSDIGILGFLEKAGEFFLGYLAVTLTLGPQVAGVVLIGAALNDLGILPTPSGGWAGVAAAGGTLLLLGPGALIPAIAVGAVVGDAFTKRQLHDDEASIIAAVFDRSVDVANVWITDLHNSGDNRNRAFTTPILGTGDIFVNVGDNFGTMADTAMHRQTLVHEFTHVWQIQHHTFSPKEIWQGLTNDIFLSEAEQYNFTVGDKWSEMNIEAQASAIALWFTIFENMPNGGLNSIPATSSPLFTYVSQNIRLGIGFD